MPDGGEGTQGGGEEEGQAGGWAERLRDWGVVTSCTEIVMPDGALEVWYYDAEDSAADAGTEGRGTVLSTICSRVAELLYSMVQ